MGTIFKKLPVKKPMYVSERNKYFNFYKKSEAFKVLEEFEKEVK